LLFCGGYFHLFFGGTKESIAINSSPVTVAPKRTPISLILLGCLFELFSIIEFESDRLGNLDRFGEEGLIEFGLDTIQGNIDLNLHSSVEN